MQTPRKYSLEELARMREAVVSLTGSHGAEDRLRTYMLNGTDPSEMEEAAEARRNLTRSEILAVEARLKRQRETARA